MEGFIAIAWDNREPPPANWCLQQHIYPRKRRDTARSLPPVYGHSTASIAPFHLLEMPPLDVTIGKSHVASGTFAVTAQVAGRIVVSGILPLSATRYYPSEIAVGIVLLGETRVAERHINCELGIGGPFYIGRSDPSLIAAALYLWFQALALAVERV